MTAMTAPRKASLLEVVPVVLSAFLGVRKRAAHEKIAVTPLQVIAVGLMGAAVFVGTIITVVRLVTG